MKSAKWMNLRQEVERELSDAQSIICVCGRLATGFHESTCRRFQNKVNRETDKRLKAIEVKEIPTITDTKQGRR